MEEAKKRASALTPPPPSLLHRQCLLKDTQSELLLTQSISQEMFFLHMNAAATNRIFSCIISGPLPC